MPNKLPFSGNDKLQQITALFIVLAVAVIGAYLLEPSHAAAPYASLEASGGQLTDPASLQTDAGTDSGQYVRFGSAPVTIGACAVPPPTWPVSDGQAVSTFWNCSSPYRTPIGNNPQIDPDNSTVINALVAQNNTMCNNKFQPCGHIIGGIEEYSTSMYYSTASDPSYTVSFTNSNPSSPDYWGPNPFDQTVTATKGSGQCNPLHIPNGVVLPGGTDKWLYVIDNTKPGLVCAMWVANYANGQWSAAYGGEGDMFGSTALPLAGAGTGSNLMGGHVLVSEVASGVIPHALQFSVNCNKPGVHRAPANKSDGSCTGSQPGGIQLEEGMHFQLDPSKVDCDTMTFAMEKMVCVALETYGAYDGDNGGSVGVDFENVAQDTNGVYAKAGLTTEYQSFPDIPLSDFRLLTH